MNNIIYDILNKYFEKEIEKRTITENDKFFKNVDLLYEQKRITLNELDSILTDFYNYLDDFVKIVSKCPFIQVCFSNKAV